MNKPSTKLALALALIGFAMSANAASYAFTDLGTLGGTSSNAFAINISGKVVGWAYNNDNAQAHAVLWNGNIPTDLGTLGGSFSAATAISPTGQVAGYSTFFEDGPWQATLWNDTNANGLSTLGGGNSIAYAINASGQVAGFTGRNESRATLWEGSTQRDLGTLGGADSVGFSINKLGQVAGYSSTSSGSTHATLWNGDNIVDLGTLEGGSHSIAFAINDLGLVVGYSQVDPIYFTACCGGYHATLWSDNTATDLGTLGGNYSAATAINNLGQVVGFASLKGDHESHATLWDSNIAIDLNSFLDASTQSAGWVLTRANGINDNGWIVGSATNNLTGISHAFMLAPVPEPDTYDMMLMGLGLMGFMVRSKKKIEVLF